MTKGATEWDPGRALGACEAGSGRGHGKAGHDLGYQS